MCDGETLRVAMRVSIAASLVFAVAGCGGGGGSSAPPPPPPPPPLSVSYSTSDVTFTATAPWAPRPPNQTVIGTLIGSPSSQPTIVVQVNNPELVTVTDVLFHPEGTGRATLVPANPSSLGAGSHAGSIVVRVCFNDPTCNTGQILGSPKTINIHYDVASTFDRDTVTPRVIDANVAGQVVLRGRAFSPAMSVAFGATPAAAVTYVSNSELRVTHPALPPGMYPVALNSGAVPFTGGGLVAVNPPSFAAAFLPHANVPTATFSLEYDAERRALLAVLYSSTQGQIVRYEHTGSAWASPTATPAPLPNYVRQIRLSHDGSRLLALRSTDIPISTGMLEYDPVTLAMLVDTPLDNALAVAANISIPYAETFALANDGNAILTTRLSGSGSSHPLIFATSRRTFAFLLTERDSMFQSVAAGDGSAVWLTTPARTIKYNASTAIVTRPPGLMNAGFEAPPSSDLGGNKIQSGTGIAGASFEPLGYVDSAQRAAVINRAGTRAYTYEPVSALMHTYDLTAVPTGGGPFPQYPEFGAPIALAGDPGNSSVMRMTITPDGRTVFIAGPNGIAVQPVP